MVFQDHHPGGSSGYRSEKKNQQNSALLSQGASPPQIHDQVGRSALSTPFWLHRLALAHPLVTDVTLIFYVKIILAIPAKYLDDLRQQGRFAPMLATAKQRRATRRSPRFNSGEKMHRRHCPLRRENATTPSFPLAMAGEGERVQIVLFRSGTMMQERLLSMGINLHDEILVIPKTKRWGHTHRKIGNPVRPWRRNGP